MSLRGEGWIATALILLGVILILAAKNYGIELIGLGCGTMVGGVAAFALAIRRGLRWMKERRSQTERSLREELTRFERDRPSNNGQ
ncbi:MAG: hypothetical protein HY716_09595 [Planctomycetes bacterium]|nr:hypothetical protein [Planctomycetota bacterium]